MNDLQQLIDQFSIQSGVLGDRVRRAQQLQQAVYNGEISREEFQELSRDLDRLDQVELQAKELEQKILFDQVIKALMAIPLP